MLAAIQKAIFKVFRTEAKLFNVKQERGKEGEFLLCICGGIQLQCWKDDLVAPQ